MSETSSDAKTDDRLSRAKDAATAVTSILAAVTATGSLVGLVWIVVEASYLPDGLPRVDGASFASLASAVAVAAVAVIAFLSLTTGAAGFALSGWRTTELDRCIRPFDKKTLPESGHFLALVAATAVLSVTPLLRISPLFLLAVPLSSVAAVVLVTAFGPEHITAPQRLLERALYSLSSAFVWLLGAVLVTLIATAPDSALSTEISWLQDIVIVAFLVIAGIVNYVAAVAKWAWRFAVALALAVALTIINPQAVLGAPFRVLRLIDTVIRFPEPVSATDRASLKAFARSCDREVFRTLDDHTYEVFVRQRIGMDWTVNCDRHGGTATFSRALVSGTLPVKSPTPSPVVATHK